MEFDRTQPSSIQQGLRPDAIAANDFPFRRSGERKAVFSRKRRMHELTGSKGTISGETSRVRRLLTFGAVGVAASAVHAAVGITLVRGGLLAPFSANVIAFLTAFFVSYFGHRNWTFGSDSSHAGAMPKFFAVAVSGLAMNQAIVFVVVDLLGLRYELALAIVFLTVPPATYVLARFWAFARTEAMAP